MSGPIAVIDYRFGAGAIANPDGTVPAVVVGATPTVGPGISIVGNLLEALRFSSGARVTAAPSPALFDPRHFCVRIVLRVTAPVTSRANLFEADVPACSLHLMPLHESGDFRSLHLMPPDESGDFRIIGTVNNARNGWSGVDTARRRNLALNTWHTLELAYDLDTLGIFVDGNRIAVAAYPDGRPTEGASADFAVGVHPDLSRFPFTGEIALLQIFNGVPLAIAQSLDDARGNYEWQIRLKENTLLPGFELGTRQGDITYHYDSQMHLQRFSEATIGHGTGLPAAYAIYGAIRERWERAGLGKQLGALVSDEADARAAGSRRSVFERGAIYWSPATDAWEVFDRPSIDYEQMGASVSALGLPIAEREIVAGGTMQRFQGGQLYYKAGATRAFEVHGAILDRYLATGGIGAWGFPVSDEETVPRGATSLLSPPPTGARQSRFENCTFFWSAATGTHEVHGAILSAYLLAGGAGMPNDDEFNGLGLPISDETDFPAWAGFGRFNTFEHGIVVWNGAKIRVCTLFQIKLGLVQTQEDEGWGQKQNDLFFKIVLSRNGAVVFSKRIPEKKAFDDDNSHDLDYLIDYLVVPNDPELRIKLSVDVWDEDGAFGGPDNRLGTFTKELNIANAWGLFENQNGVFVATGVDKIDRLEWQVQPRQPSRAPRDFWETGNPSTPNIVYSQYAAAFTDVDDDPEWTDPADWAQREVFGRIVKPAASNGNCFGFCVEALYAWFGHGFGLPLSRFTSGDWESIRNTINIKQIYQIGSDALAHFQDQKEDRMTPSAIFYETQQRFSAGDPCVICMYSNSDYTGTGHCVLPFAWDDTVTPWVIEVFDPNGRNIPARIEINPNDSFSFAPLSLAGSMQFVPWSALNYRQNSPAWDPNSLLLALLIVVVGANATTIEMTDSVGENLWLPHNPLREPGSGSSQFSPVTVTNGELDGEILVRRVRGTAASSFGIGDMLDLNMAELKEFSDRLVRGEVRALNPQPLPRRLARTLAHANLTPALRQTSLRDLLNGKILATATDPKIPIESLQTEVAVLSDWFSRQSTRKGPDFVHRLRGKRRGQFDYLTRWRLTETRMRCALGGGETHKLEASGLAGRMPLYRLTAQRDKLVSLEHTVRLGRSSEFAQVLLSNLPMRTGVPLNVAVRGGLAGIEILTAGERVDVPVQIKTWRGAQQVTSHFTVPMEGGLRLAPSLHAHDVPLKAARIETLFGSAETAQVLYRTN